MPGRLASLDVLGRVVVCLAFTLPSVSPDDRRLATLRYVVHWLGDSLDGSLARFGQIKRPHYDCFLDHDGDTVG